jgi:hypothetical protein
MKILAFFDTNPQWRALREARPASRQHFPLNLPSTLGQYDLTRPEQVANIVAMAKGAGIDGFVVDCEMKDGAYRHDAAFLAGQCDDTFGLAVRWNNETESVWLNEARAAERAGRAEQLMAAVAAVPPMTLDGRLPLIVEAPKNFADPKQAVALLRQTAAKARIPGLYLIANRAEDKGRFLSAGFDSLIDPSPDQWHSCPRNNRASGLDYLEVLAGMKDSAEYLDRFFDYLPFTVSRMINREKRGKSLPRVFGAFHNWPAFPDGGATHLVNYNNRPVDTHLFGLFIENAMLYAHRHMPAAERAVFLQSWNGWMDGSQIEPSLLDGDQVYDCVRAAIDRGRYMIRTRGENLADIDEALKERIKLLIEAARSTL